MRQTVATQLGAVGKIGGVIHAPPIAPTIKYCLYVRKSTEADELQALSIDSQIQEMTGLAKREGLNVIDIRQESHSAKDSGERPIFNQMISDIKKGLFNGVIAWSPDRLSRNAGDLGTLVDFFDRGNLIEIRTYSQKFTNSPSDKFLLMILGSQAKLENDNKGESVKRGLRAKAQMGWRPGMPPIGYLFDRGAKKGERKILLDPKRAQIVKQMFEHVANEGWNGHDVFRWMRKINFTTRTEGKMYLSRIYIMLRDPFYFGKYEYPLGSGVWYDGAHDPIITKEIFGKAQEQLANRPNLRPGTKEFDFTRLIKCGGCGSGVTAEEKFKKISDGSIARYVYYHCSRVIHINRDCHEPYIREEELITQLLGIIDKMDIDRISIKDKLQLEMDRFQKFAKSILGQENYLQTEVSQVNVRNYAKYVLTEGSRDEKREFLSCLKSELRLKDKKLYLSSEAKSKRKKS